MFSRLSVICFSAAVLSHPTIRQSGLNPVPGYVCPQQDIDATGCRGPKDCIYPNPDDCQSFIQCNDGGLAYVMACAPGYMFNSNKNSCLYPNASTCPSGTQEVALEVLDAVPPVNMPTVSGYDCKAARQKDGCDVDRCFYAKAGSLTNYILCEDGLAFLGTCGSGTEWKQSVKACELE